ncbi:MAG: GNAT family N-acetyltransferase [Chloroflexota bacterium]
MNLNEVRQQFFPFTPISTITVRAVDSAIVYEVTGKIADQVFTPSPELGLMPFRPAPQLLRDTLKRHSEQFVFYNDHDEPIGWTIGEQREADIFLMLWTGILPAYQNQGIYSAFLRHFLDYLKTLGYVRVTSNHMVNNRAVLVAKLKAGFIVTGMSLDERLGAVLWLTHYLEADTENAFRSAFSLETYPS